MAVTGHASLAEAEKYVRAANQAKLADAALARIATNREQELSNLPPRLDNLGAK